MGTTRRKMTWKRVVVLLIVLGVAVAAGKATYAWLRPVVTVTKVMRGPVVEAFYATGTVLPDDEFPVKASLAGTLTEVTVSKGDTVKQGQRIGFVEDPEMRFRLAQAQAELHERQKLADASTSPPLAEFDAKISALNEQMAIADREKDRVSKMVQSGAANSTDLDQVQDRVSRLVADLAGQKAQRQAKKLELDKNVEVAQAALDIAQWNVDQQILRAPVDGKVLDRPQTLGTRLAVNDHIMQVADVRPENLVMRCSVDEEDIVRVQPGQKVQMTLYAFAGREPFIGKVKQIYDKADEVRRTFEVDVAFENVDPRLAAGMTGELAFIIAEKDSALLVPSQAIQAGGLWTVGADGRLAKIDGAKVGLRSVERTEVGGSVTEGQTVVISALGALGTGQRVRLNHMDADVAAGLNKPVEKTDGFKGF